MKTIVVNSDTISREWFVVDAANKVVGRLASSIAQILIGKNKVAYSPNQDHGDNIIVINSDKVKLTGKKPELKKYFSHSTYPGGKKSGHLKSRCSWIPPRSLFTRCGAWSRKTNSADPS